MKINVPRFPRQQSCSATSVQTSTRMSGYVPGEQPQGGKVHQAQHEREPLPALARGGRGRRRGARARTAKISRPDGRGLSLPRGRVVGRAVGVDPRRQRQRRHPHDRHPRPGRRRPAAAAALSQLYSLPHAGRTARRAERGGPLPARLVAVRGLCLRQRRSAAGLPGQSQQPLGHRGSARGRAGVGPSGSLARCWSTRPTPTLPKPTAWTWWPGARRSWSRGR